MKKTSCLFSIPVSIAILVAFLAGIAIPAQAAAGAEDDLFTQAAALNAKGDFAGTLPLWR